MDELGRCESCGKYVPELELKSVEFTDTELNKTQEYLWCPVCYVIMEEIMDTNQEYFKRKRPERR